MTIKAILFDLDGVLVNTRTLHFDTFRRAYETVCAPLTLSWKEHLELYDGLSTRQKIAKMISLDLISAEKGEDLFDLKQKLTMELLGTYVSPRPILNQMLAALKQQGYRLVCASNSIRATLDKTVELLKIQDFFEFTLSNNDVLSPKPSSEIYLKCFERLQVLPQDCLICEDSDRGREAAYASGAHVLEIEDAEDLTFEKLQVALQTDRKMKHPKIQVVVPMAGEGSRFRVAGYTVPKPFIPVFEKPMIQWVIDNVKSDSFDIEFLLLCRKSHIQAYDAGSVFDSLGITYRILPVETLTEGAACTVLLAKEFLRKEDPLVIVNSDQYLEWDASVFYRCLMNPTYDGVISTFYSPDPSDTKWSFAKVNENLLVTDVAEKIWLGPNATTGVYGWKRAGDYIHYAESMIRKNIRVKNEFYVCPVYNEAIQDGKLIRTLDCKKLWGLGVPEDLDSFLKNFSDKKFSS